MTSTRHRATSTASQLRWFILASLGSVVAGGCGGRSFASDFDDDDDGGGGGVAGGTGMARGGTGALPPSRGGAGGYGGAGGTSIGGTAGTGEGGAGMVAAAGSAMTGAGGSAVMSGVVPGRCRTRESLGGGFQRCDSDQIHREPGNEACGSAVPRPLAFDDSDLLAIEQAAIDRGLSLEDVAPLLGCTDDRQCTAAAYGHCARAALYSEFLTECRYGCTTDAECGSGQICFCGDPVGTCVTALCQNDRECSGDLRCTAYDVSPGCDLGRVTLVFSCQSYADECASDADCGGDTRHCVSGGDRRVCGPSICVAPPPIGRPFLVDAAPRLATSTDRADFHERGDLTEAPVHPLVAEDPELRARLADAWVEMGLMEHASIAAFARFALQLLSLGAPAELLTATARAIQDETSHARSCFALARRYSGRDVGPGALDTLDALGVCDLRDSVLTAVEEGCIGETLAALEAAEAAEHCVDAATRALLERIASDEAQHAALAWRFVAWALPRCSDDIVQRVRTILVAARDAARGEQRCSPSRIERELLHFGVVGPEMRAEIRCRAAAETLWPCAEVLLGSLGSGPTTVSAARRRPTDAGSQVS